MSEFLSSGRRPLEAVEERLHNVQGKLVGAEVGTEEHTDLYEELELLRLLEGYLNRKDDD